MCSTCRVYCISKGERHENEKSISDSALCGDGALVGCGKGKEAEVTADLAEAKSQAQFECGKKTDDSLNTAADICIEMMDSIYNGWVFATYDADDYSSTKVVAAFADEVNLTSAELDAALKSAKTELKTMTAEYTDYSEYPKLKSYYAKVNSYAEFCKDSQGSFEQLKTTIQDYENEIRTFRADLEFIFE